MTNGTDKLALKQYSKFDKPFMPFGSIMHGLRNVFPTLTEPQREKLIQWAWDWSVNTVNQHVENMYRESITANVPKATQAL